MGFQYQIDKAYLQVFLSIICRLVIDINLTGIFETLVCISSNVSWLFVKVTRTIIAFPSLCSGCVFKRKILQDESVL